MKNLKKTLLGLLLGVFLLSCQKHDTDPAIRFAKPTHFPEPVYDFSRNPVTNDGFKLGRKLFF
jgi:cytochrome c peroxidase